MSMISRKWRNISTHDNFASKAEKLGGLKYDRWNAPCLGSAETYMIYMIVELEKE